jgi:hypothetical protein
MRSSLLALAAADLALSLQLEHLEPRLNNSVGRTPALGWNSWVLTNSLSRTPILKRPQT